MSEEHNQETGQALQAARIEKGLSLDDIQQMTKIQKRYLQAIENGQFDQLPGKFYERAFVRQYAASVGLDADKFIEDHEVEPASADTDANLDNARVDTDNVTRAGIHHETETPVDKTRQVMPKVLIAVAVVAVIAIVWMLVSAFTGTSKSESNSSSVSVSSSKVESSSKSESSSNDKAKSSDKQSNSSQAKAKSQKSAVSLGAGTVSGKSVSYKNVKMPNKTVNLKLSASSSAWLQVTDNNGNALYNGTLKANQPTNVKIGKDVTSIHLQIGNAQPLKVALDGQQVPLKSNNETVWNAYMQFKR
ncbi:cytoskeletal protein RodZ [Weissella uvarum]|uniref:helix-turn-helix domain-containing protein n=1 Tax=Weissella uvarum TaxID=1479233 RepID=UPI00196150CA|nr:helix-turn-helix domain-containing protein [Weissella uvarum]MBM7617130.1 cytoskeletal protein RodZ [Weissella uvarum]MCM0595426.1 DUF4115 domain-containing protein [Weissella uvarum]